MNGYFFESFIPGVKDNKHQNYPVCIRYIAETSTKIQE